MNGTRIWDSWCRLCAKENGNQVNVLVKSEETCGTDLSQIIQKYFNVEVSLVNRFYQLKFWNLSLR